MEREVCTRFLKVLNIILLSCEMLFIYFCTYFYLALDKQCFQQLLCNESHSFNVEYIDLNVVAQGIKNAKYLESLQIPLFIFTETDDESLFTFIDALCTKENLHTLQIFPLFEHLENSASDLDPILFTKITKIFTILFDNLCHAKYIKRLYIEMIGAESEFFNACAAKSFEMFLIQNCSIQELYLPFCYLIDLNPGILQSFPNCKQLISIKDDNLVKYALIFIANIHVLFFCLRF